MHKRNSGNASTGEDQYLSPTVTVILKYDNFDVMGHLSHCIRTVQLFQLTVMC